MSQATQKRFEKLGNYIEQWGVLTVLIGIVAPTVVHVVSSLNKLPIL